MPEGQASRVSFEAGKVVSKIKQTKRQENSTGERAGKLLFDSQSSSKLLHLCPKIFTETLSKRHGLKTFAQHLISGDHSLEKIFCD